MATESADKSCDVPGGVSGEELKAEIEGQGSKVRELKASGADKVSQKFMGGVEGQG